MKRLARYIQSFVTICAVLLLGMIFLLGGTSILGGCAPAPPFEEATDEADGEEGATLLLSAEASGGGVADLPEEYAILNLSLFMAEPGGDELTDRFVYQPSTPIASADPGCLGCRQVKLPVDPTTLGRKDIYVIANHDNVAALGDLRTVTDLKNLRTTRMRNEGRILLSRGLPMYGESPDTDLGAATSPTHIRLSRVCAKIQVDLTFTDPSWTGSNNYFRVEDAASYTYFAPNANFSIGADELIEYPQIILIQQDAQRFSGTAYIYESARVPHITLYTVVGGRPREYVLSTNFPLPTRGRMYHISVEIFPPLEDATRGEGGEARVVVKA
ncbi:MAG: hypothetical protein LBN29_09875 [Mediterranea sp.]|jgi:hypothetical protein|nr:hypothetical protein [Mediterranea sp.]